MNIPLSAEIHGEGHWFVAFCPEVPEANGQGRTQEECLQTSSNLLSNSPLSSP